MYIGYLDSIIRLGSLIVMTGMGYWRTEYC